MTDDSDTAPPPGDDERYALVSAYVDGEATAAERARVEAAPELLALAERYRASKAIVADVPPLGASRKQSILDAAAAEHDTLHSSARPSAATVSTPPRPARGVSTRWLSIAAALVAVCAGGVLVASRLGDRDSDDSTDVASEANATAPNFALDGGGTTERTAGAGDEQEGTVQEDGQPAPPVTVGEAADATTAGESVPDMSVPATVLASGQAFDVPAEGELVEVTDAGDLVAWLTDAEADPLGAEGEGTEICDHRIVGWAKYRAPTAGDDTAASVLVVVVQPRADRLIAVDPGSCEVVLRADLP